MEDNGGWGEARNDGNKDGVRILHTSYEEEEDDDATIYYRRHLPDVEHQPVGMVVVVDNILRMLEVAEDSHGAVRHVEPREDKVEVASALWE